MEITDLKIIRVSGNGTRPDFPPGDRQAQPMDLYPGPGRTQSPRKTGQDDLVRALYVRILAGEGLTGIFGPITEPQAYVIQRQLRPFLIGKDALANELLLDQMLRLDRHGRSGQFMTGVSPVDCALWDLKGKAWNQPVYRLLGGPTRPRIPAYASMLGFSIEPDAAARTAQEYKETGFPAQKWFFRHGPGDGSKGLQRNLDMARAVRSAVGENYPLMFDAFMGWTASYAREMLLGLEEVRPAWMEEPIPPERVGVFRTLRSRTTVPIATGEHVYTRWQVKELLANEAVDVIQADPDWTGGITELVKIAAICSAFEVPLVAHGHSLLPALHVAGSQSPATVPYVEYLIRHQAMKQFLHSPIYVPENGSVVLPEAPGLGIILDPSRIVSEEEVVF